MAPLHVLLRSGFGYSALPALAAKSLVVEGLRFRVLAHPAIRRKLYVVKKKGRSVSPAAYAFFKAMLDSLERMAPDDAVELAFTRGEIRDFCGR